MPRGMTSLNKLLAAHAGLNVVREGQLIECRSTRAGARHHRPPGLKSIRTLGRPGRVRCAAFSAVPDHFVPYKVIASARRQEIRAFLRKKTASTLFRCGQNGLEHALLPEQGLVGPGD
jgi:3-isopropylmalate/(R)-2-methylmalate dehydratase large subunit